MFADYLLERGDLRGEALALELSGQYSRLAQLTRKHLREWLGPWAELVDPAACELFGGFPVKLAFKRGAPASALEALPPTLKHLAADWRVLSALAERPPRGLEVLEVTVGLGMAFSDFRALAEELDPIAKIVAPRLQLVIDGFAGVEAATFVAEGFLRSALAEREVVTLLVRDGSMDAACSWLYQAPQWGGGDRWGARWGGSEVILSRDERGRFTQVHVDVSFDDDKAIAARCASAASLLSQLRRMDPTHVEVLVRDGQRVGKRLLDTLNAPKRFLPRVGKVRVVRKK
ncbi:MAG: hypothetical protein IPJ65_07905 [Archangiaceae bacterium]|nr:hypothetical protein [Archangiaceae bacterium]